jgi:hypothetical protein
MTPATGVNARRSSISIDCQGARNGVSPQRCLLTLTSMEKIDQGSSHRIDQGTKVARLQVMLGFQFVARPLVSPREQLSGGRVKIRACCEQQAHDGSRTE